MTQHHEGRVHPTFVAVTSDLKGNIHHHLAAHTIEIQGKRMGLNIKVEEISFKRHRNVILPSEIDNAEAVLIVGDEPIDTTRFIGKRVLFVTLEEVVKDSHDVLERLQRKDIPILEEGTHVREEHVLSPIDRVQRALTATSTAVTPFIIATGILMFGSFIFGLSSFVPTSETYNSFSGLLMEIGGGVALQVVIPAISAFLAYYLAGKNAFPVGLVCGFLVTRGGTGYIGAVLAGLLAGWIMILLYKGLSSFSKRWEGTKQLFLYPVLGVFLAGSFTHYFVNDILVAVVKLAEQTLEGLVAGSMGAHLLLGALIGLDFGGPFSKLAITYSMIQTGDANYVPLASVMAGGMAIPLGIALSTLFARKIYNYSERFYGRWMLLFSAAFIPEGAISFSLRNPLLVGVSSIVGSAVASLACKWFDVGVTVPQGGLFALKYIIGSELGFLGAVLLGGAVSALLLTFGRRLQK